MSLRYPDFLGPSNLQQKGSSAESEAPSKQHNPPPPHQPSSESGLKNHPSDAKNSQAFPDMNLDSDLDFDSLLKSKLSALSVQNDSHRDDLSAQPPLSKTSFSPLTGAHNGFGLDHSPAFGAFGEFGPFHKQTNTFHLPLELQGGIGNISSRRPSYAAESFTRSQPQQHSPASQPFAGPAPSTFHPNAGSSNKTSLASFAAANNFSLNASQQQQQQQQQSSQHSQQQNRGSVSGQQLGQPQNQHNFGQDALSDSLQNLSLNANLSDFQARRPSQLADYQAVPQSQFYPSFTPQQSSFFASGAPVSFNSFHAFQPAGSAGMPMGGAPSSAPQGQNQQFSSNPQVGSGSGGADMYPSTHPGQTMKLDNGLLLKDQYIMVSPELKQQFLSAVRYFQDPDLSNKILNKLYELLANPVVQKLVTFVKNLNNLTFNHKMLCLVVNKNGKLDLLSYPSNSNIFLQRDNLVIVDGDRGKDLVMILEPLVNLDFAILFNFLKKIEHLKSLTINDANGGTSVKGNHSGGTHSTSMDASAIINKHSNEDNEFIITLPTKQVLRFATPKEISKLSGKFLEEKKAFITCFNKIKELGLSNDLTLINVEYQCDFKKLIFYYYADFKRIDFRGLIKELFKIYKTRIWLCAVLPYDRRELYTNLSKEERSGEESTFGCIPKEYELSNEQIMNFSVKEFGKLPKPTYFHSKNMYNLVLNLENDLNGKFYGFTSMKGNSGIDNSVQAQEDLSSSGTSARGAPAKGQEEVVGKNGRSPNKKKTDYQITPSFDPFGKQKNV
ncbi:hypothetical protein CJI97_005343 [Candidozyma auris]|nr:hypothetical protein CJI97_005343 [[Candida] auris]